MDDWSKHPEHNSQEIVRAARALVECIRRICPITLGPTAAMPQVARGGYYVEAVRREMEYVDSLLARLLGCCPGTDNFLDAKQRGGYISTRYRNKPQIRNALLWLESSYFSAIHPRIEPPRFPIGPLPQHPDGEIDPTQLFAAIDAASEHRRKLPEFNEADLVEFERATADLERATAGSMPLAPNASSAGVRELSPTGRDDKSTELRPSFHRDHLWLTWYEDESSDCHHSPATIRDRWNALSGDERKSLAERSWKKIGDAENGRAVVVKAVERAKRESSLA